MGMPEILSDQPSNDSPLPQTQDTYRFALLRESRPTSPHSDVFPGAGEHNEGIQKAFNGDFFKTAVACEKLARYAKDPAQTLQDALVGVRTLQVECLRTSAPPSSKLAIDGLLNLAAQSLGSALGIAAENGGTYASERTRQDSTARLTQAVRHADQILDYTTTTLLEDGTFPPHAAKSLSSGLRLVRSELEEIGTLKRQPSKEMSAIAPALEVA